MVSEVVVMKKSTTDHQRDKYGPYRPSQLFLLRVWMEGKKESNGPERLSGKVQDPVSGQVQYFRGGMELVRILHRTICEQEARGPAEPAESCPT